MKVRSWLVAIGLLAILTAWAPLATRSYAQQAPPPGEHWREQVTIIAGKLGMSEAGLQSELVTNHKSVATLAAAANVALSAIVDALLAEPLQGLNSEVQDGRITQAQADERLANLRNVTTQQLNRPGWPVPPAASPYGGPGYPEAPLAEQLAIIAGKLGSTVAALQAELETNHKSVAQLAAAAGIDLGVIVDALTAEPAEDLAAEVQAGRMTREQADDRLADLRGDTTTHLGWPGWPIPPADGGNNHWREQVTIIAGKLGMSEAGLQSELVTNHKSVAALAAAANVALSDIVDALLAEPLQGLNSEVQDGRITQAQADERLANLRNVTTQQLNRPGWPVPPPQQPGS